MSLAEVGEAPQRSLLFTLPARALRLLVGGLLCTSPLLSLVALGWLSRRMRLAIDSEHAGFTDAAPGWILGPRGRGWIVRLAGGLAGNIRSGVVTAAGLAALSLPFTSLWLLAWWAGWENSFNKGYEQAWVGPTLGLAGTLVALVALAYLPIALAHQAATDRFGAFFEWGTIRDLAGRSGWRLPALALVSAMLAFPLFAVRALPAFAEGIVPGFSDMNADEVERLAGNIQLLAGLWTFAALWALRLRAARLYARAIARPASGRVARVLWPGLSAAIWFALVAQVFVGQFLNHSWALWLTHPLFLLPWPG